MLQIYVYIYIIFTKPFQGLKYLLQHAELAPTLSNINGKIIKTLRILQFKIKNAKTQNVLLIYYLQLTKLCAKVAYVSETATNNNRYP
jgi:hypothetical protein